jgi:hypothetical protein
MEFGGSNRSIHVHILEVATVVCNRAYPVSQVTHGTSDTASMLPSSCAGPKDSIFLAGKPEEYEAKANVTNFFLDTQFAEYFFSRPAVSTKLRYAIL